MSLSSVVGTPELVLESASSSLRSRSLLLTTTASTKSSTALPSSLSTLSILRECVFVDAERSGGLRSERAVVSAARSLTLAQAEPDGASTRRPRVQRTRAAVRRVCRCEARFVRRLCLKAASNVPLSKEQRAGLCKYGLAPLRRRLRRGWPRRARSYRVVERVVAVREAKVAEGAVDRSSPRLPERNANEGTARTSSGKQAQR
jgi:hypothetical protein